MVARVAGKWETTGLELDIEGYVLQAIKTPNGSNEFHSREMFRRWLAREQGCGALPRTWSSVLDAVERNCGSEVSQYLRNLDHSPKFIGHQHSNRAVAVHVQAYTLYIHHPHACLYS